MDGVVTRFVADVWLAAGAWLTLTVVAAAAFAVTVRGVPALRSQVAPTVHAVVHAVRRSVPAVRASDAAGRPTTGERSPGDRPPRGIGRLRRSIGDAVARAGMAVAGLRRRQQVR